MNENYQNLTKQERRELRRQEKEQFVKGLQHKRLTKRVLLWLVVVIVIGGAVWGMVRLGTGGESSQPSSLVDTASLLDWSKGDKEGKVILVEYSDFQCPACGTYYPFVKQLVQEYSNKIKFVYRHFPLPNHRNARSAAEAAEAAGKQEKFWEMHDILFENQREWSERIGAKEIFEKYAKTLELDLERFKTDLALKEIKEKVENNYQSGIKSGVNATPSFFLNGKKIQNPRSYDEFRIIIEQASNTNS
ncbi:DsbA family protein [Candidatus Jorgensenbacteria bacterium]|nr:DsbA family protein [Candidatus Jorgensenbacteria bacterium]